MPLWYKERIEECNDCPFNSKNKKKKSLKELILSLVHKHCTICGCTIKDKAAGEFEQCPKGKWKDIELYD